MPRPVQGAQLIKLRENEPNFMRGDWWSTYKEARVFYPLGFPDVMATLNIYSVDDIAAVAADAVAFIKANTNWPQQLKVRGHWDDCIKAQMKHAAGGKPMLLPKAAIALEALQIVAGPGIDVYEVVPIIAAASGITGLTLEMLIAEHNSQSPDYLAYLAAAKQAGQAQPDLLLRDLVKGHYATYSVCSLIKETFTDHQIEIVETRRPGRQGVKPASDFLKPI